MQGPLSATYLEAAAPGYWDSSARARATDGWFTAAFDFAKTILHGATAVLPEVPGEEIGSRLGWTVADYLLQTLVRQFRTTPVRPSTWLAIAEQVPDPQDLLRAGIEAEKRLLYAEAETLYRRAGTTKGINRLTAMQSSRGYPQQVLPTLNAAVDAGLPVAMQLANWLAAEDRLDDAIPFFDLAAEQGVRLARRRLATLLSQAGRLDEALVQWRRVYALEDRGPGRDRVAETLIALGRADEADAFLTETASPEEPRPVVEAPPDPDDVALRHAEALVEEGQVDEAVEFLHRRIDELDPTQGVQHLQRRDLFRWSLLGILRDHGGLPDQVDVMKAMMRERPNSDALALLSRAFCELGEVAELSRMVEQGMSYAPEALAKTLREHDYDALWQRARDGERAALRVLTEDLVDEGRGAEAIALWQAACETASDREQLARLLEADGRDDEALALLREAAESESGDVDDMRTFVDLLASLGHVDDLDALADRGIPAAEEALATIMAATDAEHDVMRRLILTARGSATYRLNSAALSDPTGPAARLLRLGLTAEGELAPVPEPLP